MPPALTATPPLVTSIAAMRAPVDAGQTRSLAWRLEQLDRLTAVLQQHEAEVLEALAADLGKPPLEATFELIAVRQELALTRRKLKGWMAPRAVAICSRPRGGNWSRLWSLREPRRIFCGMMSEKSHPGRRLFKRLKSVGGGSTFC